MTLITPLALAGLVSIPILLVFYLLKVRRQDYEVGSTVLWEQLFRDLVAHEPWQRLRITPLLLLQLAILLLLVLGLTRPAFLVRARSGGTAVIVLDESGSMQATDVKPDRFTKAKQAAEDVVGKLSDEAEITVIGVKSFPELLVNSTSNKRLVYQGLDQARASASDTNMHEALTLAASLVKGKPNSKIFVISDGAFPDLEGIGDLQAEIHFIPIGERGDSQAITLLAARRDPANNNRHQVFVRVMNFGANPVSNAVTLFADGKVMDSRQIKMDPHGKAQLIFSDVPATARVLQARLQQPDILPAANTATQVLAQSGTARVLLVSAGNLFLERALNLIPGVELFKVHPRRYLSTNTDSYNLFVFDGYLPPELPRGQLLVFNPPDSSMAPIEGELRRPPITNWDRQSPILQFVDFNDVHLGRARAINRPDWARMLVQSADKGLIMNGVFRGDRAMIFAFDLHQSDLPLKMGFPILVANSVNYLTAAGAPDIQPPPAGGILPVRPVAGADEIRVTKPDGKVTTLKVQGKEVAFKETDQAGLYSITQRAGSTNVVTQQFAVNLDEAEANITPRKTVNLGGKPLQEGPLPDFITARKEIWQYLLLAALATMMVEWWWFHRRA